MPWNHRVIKYKNLYPEYAIHEVYYNKAGKPNGYSVDAVGVYASSIEDIRACLLLMLSALDKPIINQEELDKNEER